MRQPIYQTWSNQKYILDATGGLPAAAYSLRPLNKAYKGAAIRVRRSIDNTLLDIGFMRGRFDVGALLRFCGVGDGFIDTWYDRINGRHLTQGGLTSQPQIVFSGAVVNANGMPSILYRPTSTMTAPQPFATLAEVDMVLVHQELVRRENILLDFTGSTVTRGAAHIPWSDGIYYFDIGNTASPPANWRVNTPTPQALNKLQVVEMNHSALNNFKSIVVDGMQLATGVATTPVVATSQFRLGVENFEGLLSEILIYDRLLTPSSRSQLTNNIRNYHKI